MVLLGVSENRRRKTIKRDEIGELVVLFHHIGKHHTLARNEPMRKLSLGKFNRQMKGGQISVQQSAASSHVALLQRTQSGSQRLVGNTVQLDGGSHGQLLVLRREANRNQLLWVQRTMVIAARRNGMPGKKRGMKKKKGRIDEKRKIITEGQLLQCRLPARCSGD